MIKRAAVVKLKTKFLAGSLILSTLFSLYTTPDNLRFTKGVVTSFNEPWARKYSWVASSAAMALKKSNATICRHAFAVPWKGLMAHLDSIQTGGRVVRHGEQSRNHEQCYDR